MTYSYSTMFRIGATHPAWILEWMLAVPWARYGVLAGQLASTSRRYRPV